MRHIELLAPARDLQVGIAAIDCGADAVYIAGPQFGARQAAGNEIDDIRRLCDHAHRFGVRIFVTLNTILYDDELEAAYRQMLAVQEAGADAIIVQDMAILKMASEGIGNIKEEIRIPLHASTQCAIRTPEDAVFLESLGFSRLILERELSLEQIRAIRDAVTCELEFFVHGALCVCYSGQCYLSELISGRSANRGACIQACRSRYDLVDSHGRTLVRDKALLSLKDYNLRDRIEDLAEAGITSFKIEGRLKNISYVKNVVRDYSMAVDSLVERHPDLYERTSFGKITGGFTPDTRKTFNRGYTELFIDGRRGRWAAMDAAKSMGEEVGEVISTNREKTEIRLRLRPGVTLSNGDGFSFVASNGNVTGFRGDICKGGTITCRAIQDIFVGAKIFRNMSMAFEKEAERQICTREIGASVRITSIKEGDTNVMLVECLSEDGRKVSLRFDAGHETAGNQERMASMIEGQIGKSASAYRFKVEDLQAPEGLPFVNSAFLNGIRRALAEELDRLPCNRKGILKRDLLYNAGMFATRNPRQNATYKNNIANKSAEKVYTDSGWNVQSKAYELTHESGAELMRTRYCIRYELGICPKYHKAKSTGDLFLLNNGRRLALHFDCKACEMTVTEDITSQSRK